MISFLIHSKLIKHCKLSLKNNEMSYGNYVQYAQKKKRNNFSCQTSKRVLAFMFYIFILLLIIHISFDIKYLKNVE